jgi:hypothetical protein
VTTPRELRAAAMLLTLVFCVAACGPAAPVDAAGAGGAASGGSGSGGEQGLVGGSHSGGTGGQLESGGSSTGGSNTGGSGGVSTGGVDSGTGASTGTGGVAGAGGSGWPAIDEALAEQIAQLCEKDCGNMAMLECAAPGEPCTRACIERSTQYAYYCPDEVGGLLTCAEEHPESVEYHCEGASPVATDPQICQYAVDVMIACWEAIFGEGARPS